jgi:hypothetical protein
MDHIESALLKALSEGQTPNSRDFAASLNLQDYEALVKVIKRLESFEMVTAEVKEKKKKKNNNILLK